MGGIAAYAVLAGMDCVDPSRMAVSGHSMGTWSSWSVGAAYSGAKNSAGKDISPKAIILQCGELFLDSVYDSENISFNNVLLVQAKYDEFNNFRDYNNTVTDELLKTELRTQFLGCTPSEAAWNTTYGSFSDGSARRIELLMTTHRLVTNNACGIAASLDWFDRAIDIPSRLAFTDQTFQIKDVLVLVAALLGISAMMVLMLLLLTIPFFASAAAPLPNRPEKAKSGWQWWKGAIITMLVAGLTYPFLTQLGHGLLPVPEKVFRMTAGNGFFCWYLFLIIVVLLTTIFAWRKAKKNNSPIDYCDLELAGEKKPSRIDWKMCGKFAVLSLLMVGFFYLLTFICETVFLLDFRYIWPFFKSFTSERILQFLVYIPVFLLFFVLNNSKVFAQMRPRGAEKKGVKDFISCWWRFALCMVGGVFLLVLLQYIPFFAGIGPGADLLFTPTFGGPFMTLLIVFVPQVIVFSVICTIAYRRTGSVYTGAFTVGMLACWIVTGSSVML